LELLYLLTYYTKGATSFGEYNAISKSGHVKNKLFETPPVISQQVWALTLKSFFCRRESGIV